MLVLSRRSQKSVVIAGNDAFARLLKITVLEIAGSKVRLDFEIDSDIPVHRKEVWDRIQNDVPSGCGRGPPTPANGK